MILATYCSTRDGFFGRIELKEKCPKCGEKRLFWRDVNSAKCIACGEVFTTEFSLKKIPKTVKNNWFFG